MDKTKIEWCDSTWNPVTGCLHDCEYCYARRIAERFSGYENGEYSFTRSNYAKTGDVLFDISEECPPTSKRFDNKKQQMFFSVAPYPFGFSPTFHRNRLTQLKRWKKGRVIFVCSMADLFGEWVPVEWITDIFNACKENPQHTYLFLTKNPRRYIMLAEKGLLTEDSNMWFGSTANTPDTPYFFDSTRNTFVSIEPILAEFITGGENSEHNVNWVIVGAETGNRKDKVVPEKSWVEAIIQDCSERSIPLLMKDSMIPVVGEENMIRQFPFPENKQENKR